jgi:DnaK suppressor protein
MTAMAARPAVGTWPRTRAPARGARWRKLLEDQWRDRLSELTVTALAYHDAAGAAGADSGADPSLLELLTRASAARRALVDVDDALARLAGGRYGLCETCGGAIPARRLAAVPEIRYCPRCETPALPPAGRQGATVSGGHRSVPTKATVTTTDLTLAASDRVRGSVRGNGVKPVGPDM